ncbi:hypothetical protein IPV08_15870 [Methylobacterium sp. SD274]|uniref:hypothetical protein n=1 Tax=Methylobacterium sp. SD274 TaxID=2782009 RepID=UPI001A96D52A|nr:hypothetical protein [Methylobacterium sp. SD274]MBO1021440.1 hypothetical protein [Methylobacterium sp. SD274]
MGTARVLFDLIAGTVTLSTNTGGVFTNLAGSIEKVSADFYPITATCATTALVSRLCFGDDAKALAYLGGTTKSMDLWACSFAPAA